MTHADFYGRLQSLFPVRNIVGDGECPNLDCLNAEELKSMSAYYNLLSKYCLLTADAQESRLSGDVQNAVELEAVAQRLYEKIPAGANW